MKNIIEQRKLLTFALIVLAYWLLILLYLVWQQQYFIPPQTIIIFSQEIKLYPLCLSLGAILALIIFERDYLQKLKITYHLDLLLLFTLGIIGARIFYVIVNLNKYNSVWQMFNLGDGGLVIWGAMFAGVTYLILKYKNNNPLFWNYLAAIFTVLPLAQAFGRWGNYFNSELIGPNGEALFLIEGIINLILFGYLYLQSKLNAKTTVAIYLIVYGLTRLLLQPLRPDSQTFALSTYLIGIIILAYGAYLYSRNFSHK